ncbi:hypothetical protein F511_30511 [Dorcoceras hygrometricum]|uniref:Uncharacterized protein n=1 Tax=Dorcoceras hygrometricum TaxID=472368 RepID=A0A2Z7AHL3_9LAMI|nr:hypothetical protein F511_30511 [Dorcoceras hygrometricum]
MWSLIWGGEVSRQISQAREIVASSKRSLDDVLFCHERVMKELEEIRGIHDEKNILTEELDAT